MWITLTKTAPKSQMLKQKRPNLAKNKQYPQRKNVILYVASKAIDCVNDDSDDDYYEDVIWSGTWL